MPMTEALFEKLNNWVDNNVPAHTRADYRALLRQNKHLWRTLVETQMSLQELQKAYREFEKEVAEGSPLPPVQTQADYSEDYHSYNTVTIGVDWRMDPYHCQMRLERIDPRYDSSAFPHFMAAIKRRFYDEYVPSLWKHTENVLYRQVARVSR